MAYDSKKSALGMPHSGAPAPVLGQKIHVLVTNDDGIEHAGLTQLAAVLRGMPKFDVRVVAPMYEHSACGHKVTIRGKIGIESRGEGSWAVDGTPADCVKIALDSSILGTWVPHIVVSGINKGPNFGLCTHVSGTVAGARQAVMQGVPGIATSLDSFIGNDADFNDAAQKLVPIIEFWLEKTHDAGSFPPPHTLLNVNIPLGRGQNSVMGLQHSVANGQSIAVPLGASDVQDEYDICNDQHGKTIALEPKGKMAYDKKGSHLTDDAIALSQGYLTMSPIYCGTQGPNAGFDIAEAFRGIETFQRPWKGSRLLNMPIFPLVVGGALIAGSAVVVQRLLASK